NEPVKAGQALARIDDRDFRVALAQAKADVDAATAAIATKQASLDAQFSAVDAARAAIEVDEANSMFAEQDDRRYTTLAASGYGSLQNAQAAASRSAASRATVQRDRAALETAVRQIGVLKAQLADVRPGQRVEIDVDTFPGRPLSGHVDSIAPASGQEFALLPPDNATGNFTKVVQRIPVKIVVDAGSPLASLLRPGMSVYPTIDTKTLALQSASVSAPRS